MWLTVKAWRGLAHNVKASVGKGEPVVVHGRLRASRWKDEETGEDRSRTVIEAVAVGHDLNRGTTAYRRTERPATRDDDVDDTALIRKVDGVEAEPVAQPGAA